MKVVFGFVAAAGEARLHAMRCAEFEQCADARFSFVRQHFVPGRFSTGELLPPARSKYFES
jgi:hypothetical protein